MKFSLFLLTAWTALAVGASAAVRIDEKLLGEKLGGWTKRGAKAAEYPLSGASYRTYKPEVTPTPEGGIFISLRIDHVRGWLSSDDHAILEITVNASGVIVSAKSNIAIQGRSIASDVIRGGTGAGQKLTGVDHAVQIGTDLVADLSEKMLREKIVEAGRVSFPAVLRHNYNLLFQAIRYEPDPKAETVEGEPVVQKPEPPPSTNANPSPSKLEIKPYDQPQVDLPVQKAE
jgi:hypothetical protein